KKKCIKHAYMHTYKRMPSFTRSLTVAAFLEGHVLLSSFTIQYHVSNSLSRLLPWNKYRYLEQHSHLEKSIVVGTALVAVHSLPIYIMFTLKCPCVNRGMDVTSMYTQVIGYCVLSVW
ncbi:hypothetical protein OTU49_000243, partial [Cherax quadricarinatus]